MRGGIRRVASLFALLAGVAPLSAILATICAEEARAIIICAMDCPEPVPGTDIMEIADPLGHVLNDVSGRPAIVSAFHFTHSGHVSLAMSGNVATTMNVELVHILSITDGVSAQQSGAGQIIDSMVAQVEESPDQIGNPSCAPGFQYPPPVPPPTTVCAYSGSGVLEDIT